jgi:hypothetical protein
MIINIGSVGFTSKYSSICSSMPQVVVNNGVTILAFNVGSWNLVPNALMIFVLSNHVKG